MNYVGIDLHKHTSWIHIMDKDGNTLLSKSITNTKEVLNDFFADLDTPFCAAVESTYNWYFLSDIVSKYADKMYLADSYQLKAFAKRNKKTDKIDARLIADILRKGYLPAVHITGKKMRLIKEQVRLKINLTQSRTKAISQLKSLLDRHGCLASGDYKRFKTLDNLNLEQLPKEYLNIAECYIKRIKQLTYDINDQERHIKTIVEKDEDMSNLTTIPGISFFSAALIKSEIADITRFKSFNRLCAYSGLAPRVMQSGNTIRYGSLNKNRRKLLQWILLETAHFYRKALPDKQKKYERIQKEKSSNCARVAVARDMLKAVYAVLKNKRKFAIA